MKRIPGFSDYSITKGSRIWSKKRTATKGGWCKPRPHPKGYLCVTLCREGKTFEFLIHRLVLETFIGPCPEGMECRHLDGDQTTMAVR